MGTYLNPGNSGFAEIQRSDYIDKTGLIGLINSTIGTMKKLTCISRPRRFGKSYAAKMLCAYYDKSCDSQSLFEKYIIASDKSYREHLNKYHVINLDITGFVSYVKKKNRSLIEIPNRIETVIQEDVLNNYPELEKTDDLNECLLELVRKTGTQIVFIIDEWDAVIREAKEDGAAQESYLNLLRGWFKNNNFTSEAVAAAYMTGILPIKKNGDGSQSAISDFQEYSVLEPRAFTEYFGFTEKEVKDLCVIHDRDFDQLKQWYDGYTVGDCHSMYNPYSVMQAIDSGKYKSYWKKTSAAETLMTYIDMNQDGLQDDIARLITGERIIVDPDSFQNDVETFTCKDDVLTLLIHLGYLTYEEEGDVDVAWIPNAEVREEFDKILRKAKHTRLIELVRKSDQLLKDTITGNSDAVARAIQEMHESEYAPTWYNNEQSLRYVVKMAYISSVDQYAKIEELPTGHGIADVVFLPKRLSYLPALIVELKRDRSSQGAIMQIREKNYPKVLEQFGGEILLVGINYDEKTKQHSCRIEKYRKAE